MADSYLQVRTTEADKQAAAAILEELGTNMSTVVNMLLKQIIITRSIPFEVKLPNGVKKISHYRTDDLKAVLSKVSSNVDEVWVFGSSVTDYCKPNSDLDICIVGHTTMKEESEMYKAANCAVDIITETPEGFEKMKNVKGNVYNEVFTKGVLVYKKGEEIKWI